MRFSYSPWNSIAIAVAILLASLTIQPLLSDLSYLAGIVWVISASAVVGALGALFHLPRLVTMLGQLVALVGVMLWMTLRLFAQVPEPPDAGNWLAKAAFLAKSGAEGVQAGDLPLMSSPGMLWLITAVVGLMLVALELLVNALEQPAWALAPLALLYAIGAVSLPTELGWRQFVLIAVAYIIVLGVATGFGVPHQPGKLAHALSFQGSRAALIAAVTITAVLLTVMISPALPIGPKRDWLRVGSDAPIQLSDPTIELNENLQRPEEEQVLTYTTSDDQPVQLRTVALTRLTSDGAQLVPMQLENGSLDEVRSSVGVEVLTKVKMSAASEYLPAPYAAEKFKATGRWAHDPSTVSIVATGPDRTEQTEGLGYSVTSLVPRPSKDELAQAMAAEDPAGEETLLVPDGLDSELQKVTDEITDGLETDGEKALAIQAFLRSDEFDYSLEAPQSTGADVISSFVLEDRSGYCIHFASAMVAMARMADIPSRMAVGYTPGERQDDGWVVTTHNMHTWPELYFEDLGWVAFEPTKSVAAPHDEINPDEPEEDEPSPSPSPSDSESVSPSPSPSSSPEPDTETGEDGASMPDWLPLVLTILVLLALPMLARRVQLSWRLRSGQEPKQLVASAWREVRATFEDLGLDWDDGTPTQALGVLEPQLNESAASTLTKIATTVERSQFAREGADISELITDVRTLRAQLASDETKPMRARMLLLPASLRSTPIRKS